DETIPSAGGDIECARRQSSFKTLTFSQHPKRRRLSHLSYVVCSSLVMLFPSGFDDESTA
ncbi:hypothetical protein, partial [Rhizobium hidalgonense]|uniref:hypothetical protein n=1 Tax=Rhizobium hidalgonense TaxID=1538159 RepID=UPI001A9D7B69